MKDEMPTREEFETFVAEHMPDTEVTAGENRTDLTKKSDDRPVCDFCSIVPGLHVYKAHDVMVDPNMPIVGEYHSVGSWGACGTCKAMIDTNDRAALLARSAKMLSKKHPNLPYAIVKSSVARSHRAFWKARK